MINTQEEEDTLGKSLATPADVLTPLDNRRMTRFQHVPLDQSIWQPR